MNKVRFVDVLPGLLRPGDVFVDVGASEGGITRLALDAGAAQVIAFEPDRRRARVDDPRVDWRTCAVSDQNGFRDLYLGAVSDQNSFVPSLVQKPFAGPPVSVPVVVLDVAVPTADVVKVDAQGWDAHVVRGAQRVLSGARALIVEVWPRGLLAAGESLLSLYDLIAQTGLTRMTWGKGDPITRDECANWIGDRDGKHGDWIATR
jgi:FkbM family methyltransferase